MVELAGIFVQIGLLPNTDWLKGTVELSKRGEIIVDARGQTSVPGVFAAGDCTTVPYKQIIIAMGAGATAALSAFDHLIPSATTPASGNTWSTAPSAAARRQGRRRHDRHLRTAPPTSPPCPATTAGSSPSSTCMR